MVNYIVSIAVKSPSPPPSNLKRNTFFFFLWLGWSMSFIDFPERMLVIFIQLIFMILCGDFFLVSSDLARDWWACIFPQIVRLPYLLFWSWAEKQTSNSVQFSLKCADVVGLFPRHGQQAGSRSTGRGSAMQRPWAGCQRTSKCS